MILAEVSRYNLPMRLLVTADLHFNHRRSRPLAEDVIERMNDAGGDVLLVVGDTASGDGPALEECLGRFRFAGPKLFVPGNHELWTLGADSYELVNRELPRRVEAIGWQWLSDRPFVAEDVAIVGSLGWYDYSFARKELGIPRRFYERKISPGVAELHREFSDLLADESDISPVGRKIIARWNDGVHVKLGRSDDAFLDELLDRLDRQLTELRNMKTIVAGIHCLPFAELLPPSHSAQWDFAKAYLGSGKIGQILLKHPVVKHVFCGHSHWPSQVEVGGIRAVNIGSGYGVKFFQTLDVY